MTGQSEEHDQTKGQEEECEASAQVASQLEYYASVIGAFKDDPMLEAMMANIRENKKKMNADDNIR